MAPSDVKHQQLAPKRAAEQWPGGQMLSVALVLLAAGGSSRMGRPQQLLDYRGQPWLGHSVEQAIGPVGRPVTGVLGSDAAACRAAIADLPVEVVVNDGWADGMGSSIRTGVAAVLAASEQPEAVLITLCDQPLITSA